MSALSKYLPKKSGVVGKTIHVAVDAALPAALVGVFGYVQNRYRDKAHVGPVPVDLAAGVVGTLGSAFFGRKLGKYARYAHALGIAGLAAYAHTIGAGLGAQSSGVKRVVVHEKDVSKLRAAVPDATVLGAIPRAPHGDFLSPAELAALSR